MKNWYRSTSYRGTGDWCRLLEDRRWTTATEDNFGGQLTDSPCDECHNDAADALDLIEAFLDFRHRFDRLKHGGFAPLRRLDHGTRKRLRLGGECPCTLRRAFDRFE